VVAVGHAGGPDVDLASVELDVAQSLLKKGEAIPWVAAALGFADAAGFTKAFKKWTGATPARWRTEQGGRL